MGGLGTRLWLWMPAFALSLIMLWGCSTGGSEIVLPRPDPTQQVEAGRTYRFGVSTHCGVQFITLAGTTWKASKPMVENGTAPAGWDPGVQRGRLHVVSANTAVFRDSQGHEVTFQRLPHLRTARCI